MTSLLDSVIKCADGFVSGLAFVNFKRVVGEGVAACVLIPKALKAGHFDAIEIKGFYIVNADDVIDVDKGCANAQELTCHDFQPFNMRL